MDSEREGEGWKIWENGIETCKISCMKLVASPGLIFFLNQSNYSLESMLKKSLKLSFPDDSLINV